MQKQPARGFTLLELIVVLVVLAVVSALAIAGMSRLRPKADLQSSVAELVAQVDAARARAEGNGSHVWVGLLPATTSEPLRYVVIEDWNGNFDPSAFAWATPEGQLDVESGTGTRRDQLVFKTRLPDQLSVSAGSGFGTVDHVPVPFRTVTPSSVTTGCSFCNTDGGWLRFTPSGEVALYDGDGNRTTTRTGGGVFVTGTDAQGEPLQTVYFISITEPFGLVRSFADAS